MALAQHPACVVTPPPVALPIKPAEVVLTSFLPSVPASEVGANVAMCLTGAAKFGVDVAGPSLPICPLVATMVLLFQLGFKV